MINLLPRESKEHLLSAYRRDVFASWLWMFAALAIVSLAFLLPVWTFLWIVGPSQNEVMALPLQAQMLTEATRAKELLALLSPAGEAGPSTNVLLDVVFGALGDGVTMSGFRLSDGKIFLSGTASDRMTLNTYVRALKANPFLASATFPVSELASRTDIPFSLVISLSLP